MSMFDKCDVKTNGNTPVTIVKGSINNNGNNNNNGNGNQIIEPIATTSVAAATATTAAATTTIDTSVPANGATDEKKDDTKEEAKDNVNLNNQLSHALDSVNTSSNRFTPYQVPNAPRYQRHRRASTGSIGDDADFKAISSIAVSDTLGGIVSLERAAGLHYGPARGSNTYTMTRDEIIRRVEMGLLDPKFLRFFDKNQK